MTGIQEALNSNFTLRNFAATAPQARNATAANHCGHSMCTYPSSCIVTVCVGSQVAVKPRLNYLFLIPPATRMKAPKGSHTVSEVFQDSLTSEFNLLQKGLAFLIDMYKSENPI